MARKRLSLVFLLWLCLPLLPAGAGQPPIPGAVHYYAAALQRYQQDPQATTLESLYLQARTAARGLAPVLEHLGHADYDTVEGIDGMVVDRTEMIYAVPDNRYFKRLADAQGGPADKAFFALHEKTRPDDASPVYLRQVTDYSGCTRYGKGELVRFYGQWQAFRQNYPAAYAEPAGEMLGDIERRFTRPVCACADKDTVVREFELFIKTYADSKLAGKLKKRIKAIHREEENGERYFCLPV